MGYRGVWTLSHSPSAAAFLAFLFAFFRFFFFFSDDCVLVLREFSGCAVGVLSCCEVLARPNGTGRCGFATHACISDMGARIDLFAFYPRSYSFCWRIYDMRAPKLSATIPATHGSCTLAQDEYSQTRAVSVPSRIKPIWTIWTIWVWVVRFVKPQRRRIAIIVIIIFKPLHRILSGRGRRFSALFLLNARCPKLRITPGKNDETCQDQADARCHGEPPEVRSKFSHKKHKRHKRKARVGAIRELDCDQL